MDKDYIILQAASPGYNFAKKIKLYSETLQQPKTVYLVQLRKPGKYASGKKYALNTLIDSQLHC